MASFDNGRWVLAETGKTCDQTCGAIYLTCEHNVMSKLNSAEQFKSALLVSALFGAGKPCSSSTMLGRNFNGVPGADQDGTCYFFKSGEATTASGSGEDGSGGTGTTRAVCNAVFKATFRPFCYCKDVAVFQNSLADAPPVRCETPTGKFDNELTFRSQVIAKGRWEYTPSWDCGGATQVSTVSITQKWDGSATAISERRTCALQCMQAIDCRGFAYPKQGGSATSTCVLRQGESAAQYSREFTFGGDQILACSSGAVSRGGKWAIQKRLLGFTKYFLSVFRLIRCCFIRSRTWGSGYEGERINVV